MILFGIVAGLLLLYSCASKLLEIASCLKDIRSSASHIQLEIDGQLQRQIAMQDAMDEIREKLRQISSVADSYEDEVLSPVRRTHGEAEFFGDIKNI